VDIEKRVAAASHASDDLGALYRIAALGTGSGDTREVVHDVLDVVADILPGEAAHLFLPQEDGARFTIYSTDGPDGEVAIADSGVIGRVAINRSAEVVNDVKADPDSVTNDARVADFRQLIAVPVGVAENARGVLAISNSTRGAFTDEDLRTLSLLGDRVSLSVHNSQLIEALERQVQELEALQRLSKLLASTDSLERVIGDAIRIVQDLVGCGKLALLLHDPSPNELVAHRPAFNISNEELDEVRIPLSMPSLAASVFRTNTPLMSNDAPNDPWVYSKTQELLDIENLAVVPLSTGENALGVMMAVNSDTGQFDEDDMKYLSLIGRQVGAVLEASLGRQRERGLVRQLREADRTKSEFVSMLAHELKGPMSTVLGFGHTLQQQWDKLSDEKRNQIVGIITKETERLSRLVTDLLDVSRMESGTLRYEMEPMSIQEVVDSIVEVHTSLQASHVIGTEIADDVPKVLGDRDRVRQILINLLTNATRYSPENTSITVGAEPYDGSFVRVWVRDEGIGIPEEDQERVFSKFSMLPKPGWVKKGTGLGLFITKGIIDAHGGRIWIESASGKGSTFSFTLRRA
jgi:K+-sensing histidine kinase KdpD